MYFCGNFFIFPSQLDIWTKSQYQVFQKVHVKRAPEWSATPIYITLLKCMLYTPKSQEVTVLITTKITKYLSFLLRSCEQTAENINNNILHSNNHSFSFNELITNSTSVISVTNVLH